MEELPYGDENKLERLEALRLYTLGSAKLSREEPLKGSLTVGKYADLAVLSKDYFQVKEETIKEITSVLTLLGGKVVYGSEEYSSLDENRNLPISPDWSPVKIYGGYFEVARHEASCCQKHLHKKESLDHLLGCTNQEKPLNPWSFGCDCFTY